MGTTNRMQSMVFGISGVSGIWIIVETALKSPKSWGGIDNN